MNIIDNKNIDDDLHNHNLDGGGDLIENNHEILDNEFAQLVQDLLEKRN